MKKFYVFSGNEDGMIEISKEELEKVLNDAYESGKSEGYMRGLSATPWYYKPSPTIVPAPTITCDSKTNPYKITLDGGIENVTGNN